MKLNLKDMATGETLQAALPLLRFILQTLHPPVPYRNRAGLNHQLRIGKPAEPAHSLQPPLVFLIRLNIWIIKKRGNAV